MGAPDSVFRLPVRVHQPPSKTLQGQLHTAPQRQGQAQGTSARNQPAPSQESRRESNPGADSFPLSLLSHHTEVWRLATYPQPQETQQIHQATSIQDGVASSHSPGTTTQLVGRHVGRYLHIAIHPFSRKWLSFAIEDEIFRFRCLPFGLSTAPHTFTRVVKVMAEHLRRQGMYVFIYLDDWLLTAPSLEILRDQKVQFLGSQLDFTRGMVFPTRRPSPEHNPVCISSPAGGGPSSPALDESARTHRQPQAHAASEHPLYADHPTARIGQVQKPQRQPVTQDQQDHTGVQHPLMVDSAIQCSPREEVCTATAVINPSHG